MYRDATHNLLARLICKQEDQDLQIQCTELFRAQINSKTKALSSVRAWPFGVCLLFRAETNFELVQFRAKM